MEHLHAASAPIAPGALVSKPLPSHRIEVMISEDQIQGRVRELGEAIGRDFPDPTEPLLLVGVLKGAALFLADLIRCIDRPVEFDFVAISSYGAATQTSGEVRILKDLDASVAGKHVLVVEDIIDTGLTLRFSYLIESLRARHARSVGVCVLLDKPSRRRVEVVVDYRGFEIPDRFVIGYGMDYAENYRSLRYIGVLTIDPEISDLSQEESRQKRDIVL
jgi:hypoxanthine phosphoribosyltransferase